MMIHMQYISSQEKFSDWISSNFSDFELYKHLPNKYPYTPDNPENTSLSDFYVYKKN